MSPQPTLQSRAYTELQWRTLFPEQYALTTSVAPSNDTRAGTSADFRSERSSDRRFSTDSSATLVGSATSSDGNDELPTLSQSSLAESIEHVFTSLAQGLASVGSFVSGFTERSCHGSACTCTIEHIMCRLWRDHDRYGNLVSWSMEGHVELKQQLNVASAIAGSISLFWQRPGSFTFNWTRERGVMLGSSLEGPDTITFDTNSGASVKHLFSFEINGRPRGRGSIHPYPEGMRRDVTGRWKSVCDEVARRARRGNYGYGISALAPVTFSQRVGDLVEEMQERGMRMTRCSGLVRD